MSPARNWTASSGSMTSSASAVSSRMRNRSPIALTAASSPHVLWTLSPGGTSIGGRGAPDKGRVPARSHGGEEITQRPDPLEYEVGGEAKV